jgi:hypothetical protein
MAITRRYTTFIQRALTAALLSVTCSVGFVVITPTKNGINSARTTVSSLLHANKLPDNRDNYCNYDSRTDVRNFLTQRAIQSFLYLLETVRDPHSGIWIEEFLETRNSLEYHGTGAGYIKRFGGTWDAPLFEMCEAPKDVIIVTAKHYSKKGQHRTSQHNNPYLDDEQGVEFEIDIDPVSLATRILSVREQIAKEWCQDLDFLKDANEQILESYFKIAKQERQKMDSELSTAPPVAFQRTAVKVLEESAFNTAEASSPFRRGNYDLLYNLCTQASIHRVLRLLQSEECDAMAREISFPWLVEFYSERCSEYFDGDVKYGRADDFMEELLMASPSVYLAEDGKMGLADPRGLAELIIETRSDIVVEWKALMQQVPQDHSQGIRKILLNKQMASWSAGPPLGSTNSVGSAATQGVGTTPSFE